MVLSGRFQCCFPAFLLTLNCLAAPPIRPPVSGWIADSSARGLRPIVGIPGAATLGAVVDSDPLLSIAAISPSQEYLISNSADGVVHVVRVPDGPATTINGLQAPVSRVVFSPTGTAALLISGSHLQVITGLPDRARFARALAVESLAPLSGMALDDSGSTVMINTGSGIFVAGESAEWRRFSALPAIAIAFVPGGRDAVIVSPGGALTIYRDPATGTDPVSRLDSGEIDPRDVAVTATGRILVAGRQGVSIIDTADASRLLVPCDCKPQSFTMMGPYYRLNSPSDGPIWMLHPDPRSPRVFFVPMLQAPAAPLAENK